MLYMRAPELHLVTKFVPFDLIRNSRGGVQQTALPSLPWYSDVSCHRDFALI